MSHIGASHIFRILLLSKLFSPNCLVAEVVDMGLCKKAAASKWMAEYMMSQKEVVLTDEQRSQYNKHAAYSSWFVVIWCGDSEMNAELIADAKRGLEPTWIKREIDELVRIAISVN